MLMTGDTCQIRLTTPCQPKFTVVLAACLVMAGCSAPLRRDVPPAHLGLERPSVSGIQIDEGSLTSIGGCELHYRVYRPRRLAVRALAVIGHGFLRRQERMAGLALALADAGISAATLDFCRPRPWAGGHYRNAVDMMRLADALGARRVVYAGFSAGGLAALAAGRNDPRALGVVALDLVDAQDLGRRMAVGMRRPLIGLVGEPSVCNAGNNGLLVYAATRQARVRRFAGADHCAFEAPTDRICALICGRPGSGGDRIRADILRAATDAVMALTTRSPGSPGPDGW